MCYNGDVFLGLQSVEFTCIFVLAWFNLVHLETLTSCSSENSHRRDHHLRHMGADISASNILDARHHVHTGTEKKIKHLLAPAYELSSLIYFCAVYTCIYCSVTRAHTRQHSFVSLFPISS